MKNTNRRRFLSLLLTVAVAVQISPPALAEEVLIFSNEVGEENGNTLILDYDDTGGDVILQFGDALGEQFFWNDGASRFELTDDLDITGDLTVSGTVDGVDISALDTTVTDHLDGGVNKHDASEIDVETAGNITTVSDLETNLGAFDAAIGDRTYTENNYIIDLESISASLDSLDQQVKVNEDAITTPSITGTDSNTFTLDVDDTGGNVELIFGTTVAEFLRHDGVQFLFSDDLRMIDDSVIEFRDAQLNIGSSVDGQLDVNADTELEINAPDVDLNGNLDVSGTVNGTDLSTTGLDFNGNSTVGTNADTLALESSNWDISDLGVTTGLSIDASTNTISNITNSEIAAGADIDFDKLATREKKIFIGMNDLTLESDGTDNQVNVYNDTEGGADPHQYYLVKSRQNSLNDIDLKFKVKLPDDFVDFSGTNDLQFSYQNTGTDVTDSKIDIIVEDKDGDAAFTPVDGQNLFSATWTDYIDEFDAGSFDPVAGDYVYVTVKGYGSSDAGTFQSPHIGEIVMNYIGR